MSKNFASSVLPSPQALLFFLAHQDAYRKPIFSPHEVFCGPDTDTREASGRMQALRTPAGSFDINAVIAQLPAAQKPEIVVVKADATGRNFPRGLAQVKCPRVLLVGDTHHLTQPLQTVLRYAREEPFDFIILDHTRHHACWFQEAGLTNVHWLPALDYGFLPRKLSAAPSRPLTFVGQAGKHHPYRRHVLNHLTLEGLPLEALTCPLAQTADVYADSQITLNISLNGDLNLRVFEALSAGGFLLTDELSVSSGLPALFNAGEHLDTWRTPGELVEKINHYLAHPEQAFKIRAAGQAELVKSHHSDVKRREFFDLVHSGKVNPRYVLEQPSRIFRLGGVGAAPEDAIRAYELLQSLHRDSAQVTVFCRPEAVAGVAAYADLPRLLVKPVSDLRTDPLDPLARPAEGELPRHHLLWWSGDNAGLGEALNAFRGTLVIAPASASAELAAWGYATIDSGVYALNQAGSWLSQSRAVGTGSPSSALLAYLLEKSDTADEALAVAELAGQREDTPLYKNALQRAIFLDRNCASALFQLGALCLELGETASAAIVLSEAARNVPLAPEIETLRRELLADHAAVSDVSTYQMITHGQGVEPSAHPRRIVVVTNLFPPEELGGYGRMMWEFAFGLRARGHEVLILTGDASYLRKTPTEDEITLEAQVSRTLRLLGEWREGVTRAVDTPQELAKLAAANARTVVQAARDFRADLILLGNSDFLGIDLLNAALAAGLPVLHALANAAPGYLPAAQPSSPRYWVAPCSDWNGRAYHQAGYQAAHVETLYPGARIDRFYRYFLPDARKLRIAYASLVMPYKGVHILIQALARLHRSRIDFVAEIAGDSTDPAFLETLTSYIEDEGMADKVRFTGFLDRHGLSALFARSNVLVFPSQFAEPFGISQVEALAAGLVVISSGTGGACEIIRHGQDGLLFPAAEPAALAERLTLLANNPELFRDLQTRGQQRSFDFSVDRAVFKIEQLVERLLAPASVKAGAVNSNATTLDALIKSFEKPKA